MREQEFKDICKLARIEYEDHMFEGFKSALDVIMHVSDFDGDLEVDYNINSPEVKPDADQPQAGLTSEEALLNADRKKYGYFVINKYVGE